MHTFTESNITLNFPDTNYFRFADCAGYKRLSGYSFKEMDACWYDTTTNTYWLFELKDFTQVDVRQTLGDKVQEFVKKAVDSLCMFLSIKHSYNAQDLEACIPIQLSIDTQFKFVIIVHCHSSQKADIQLLHNSFRHQFKPYSELFNVKHYAVMEHSSAIKNIPRNVVQ